MRILVPAALALLSVSTFTTFLRAEATTQPAVAKPAKASDYIRFADNGADGVRIARVNPDGALRLDRARGGLGLGLTIVRNMVDLHGGTVEALSDGRGKGSTFIVRLPAAPALALSIEGVPAGTVPPAYFCRGCYFTLTGKSPFRHLIYPVPVPGGLGVHITLDLAGQARFGPDVEWIGDVDYSVDPRRGDLF